MPKSHYLAASADACHWGYFDASRPAQITIMSGDDITIDTVTGAPETVRQSLSIRHLSFLTFTRRTTGLPAHRIS